MDAQYWNDRYLNNNAPWDVGKPTPPIVGYFEGVEDLSARILIPGGGNGHEAAHLFRKGFQNVYLCDWAEAPLRAFAEAHPDFPERQLIESDFFQLEGEYDFIVEQTFFCAIPPERREEYARQAASLLAPAGRLVGVMFDRVFGEGPPFGGSRGAYESLFQPHFSQVGMKPCGNSIPPRMGTELFVELLR